MKQIMVSELHSFIIAELMKESAKVREAASIIDIATKRDLILDRESVISELEDARHISNKYIDLLVEYLKSKAVSNSQ